ncbi:NAD(P)/FAD-dependent oxidoreductase [Salinibacterium soli]|uniref:FAD-dependent monooxygenase n=1 Tax=Antiquaquibacter soli TaxID=3064523 RepID=A0ABT9BR59_9MICO|nr:FAD-dependent monooxygenase [Protaetiibacter sp. WY-16]MDO7883534.1 FAD-dependent monooxygenase [Protaetiibacter sp. WY-16]
MSRDADVLVVGGGPVGLAAAIEARLAGLSVVVLEPREGPVDKACGEGLMPGALPLLERLGVDPEGAPLVGVSYRSRGVVADHRFEGGPGRGVRRTVLHAALADRARALGVSLVTCRAEGIAQDASGVTAGGLRADWLLAADGLHSPARRALGLERPGPTGQRRFGIRQHFEVAPWNDHIEVHWTRDAEVYVTPLGPDLVGVAVLGVQGADIEAAIASTVGERLRDARPLSDRRGAGPFGQRAARVQLGRVLLVGDASGYVDAITGEGLRLGFEQARVAVAALTGGRPYEREWRRVTRPFRVLTRGLVGAASSPLRGGIVPLAARAPRLYGAVVERLAR